MAVSSETGDLVVPARLSFLAIYNPSLGTTDETIADQIVFYSSKYTRSRRSHRSDGDGEDVEARKEDHDEENEKLRNVGLAQGMVDFAKNFSNGTPVDSVETEKSRIVLHELEPGWWILASIDLTRLPKHRDGTTTSQEASGLEPKIEYSAREVSSAPLLKVQLLRAHGVFLLHHGSSLSDLYGRMSRDKFCSILDRFWVRFIWNWDVLLHGNPAVDIYHGIKLAGGGELGVGVGEEEWGSGEREVLEDFVRRTDGLVDVVVSKFGKKWDEKEQASKSPAQKKAQQSENQLWLGTGQYPDAADGVIFSGTGAISRSSLRDISIWIEWLYSYGEDAYGVKENPHSTTMRKKRRKLQSHSSLSDADLAWQQAKSTHQASAIPIRLAREAKFPKHSSAPDAFVPPGIPPPLVTAAGHSLNETSAAKLIPGEQSTSMPSDESGAERWMKYLTLGYGSSWGSSTPKKEASDAAVSHMPGEEGSGSEQSAAASLQNLFAKSLTPPRPEDKIVQRFPDTFGRFLIGLKGDLDNELQAGTSAISPQTLESDTANLATLFLNERILLRTIYVSLAPQSPPTICLSRTGSNDSTVTATATSLSRKRFRVVIYVHQPFLFLFLFKADTSVLDYPSFYRSLHAQLGPLQKSLLSSTDPSKISVRLMHATTLASPPPEILHSSPTIYSLIHDPQTLTTFSNLPTIPLPGTLATRSLLPFPQNPKPISRIDALNIHGQILELRKTAYASSGTMECAAKTSRGWWVVWLHVQPSSVPSNMYLPSSTTSSTSFHGGGQGWREAIFVRSAVSVTEKPKRKRTKWASWSGPESGIIDIDRGSEDQVSEVGGIGIGVDMRKYAEGLLSLGLSR